MSLDIALSFIRWLHFVALFFAGGCMPVCLLLSGFEDTREDIRGLSAVIWKKIAIWAMRFAVLTGAVMFVMVLFKGDRPFSQPHLMFMLGLSPFLILLCEKTPNSLGMGKRGIAMLITALFLATSFVATYGKVVFSPEPAPPPADPQPAPAVSVEPEHSAQELQEQNEKI